MSVSHADKYFTKLHDIDCNQKYGYNLPYSFHLHCVYEIAQKFLYLIRRDVHNIVLISCFGHDSIEDARISYNDIKSMYGEQVAEIIYLCTENKGRTRNERKDSAFYNELFANELAVFVKLCDLIANVSYSILSNSKMFDTYKQEYNGKIKPKLMESSTLSTKYVDIIIYIEKLFNLNN